MQQSVLPRDMEGLGDVVALNLDSGGPGVLILIVL